jgi:hypothetical protein
MAGKMPALGSRWNDLPLADDYDEQTGLAPGCIACTWFDECAAEKWFNP